MSPKELTEDIWFQIVRTYISSPRDVSSIASTSKLIRLISLPILYHQLNVTFGMYGTQEDELSRLRQISRRVKALQGQTQLLDRVRELHLHFALPALCGRGNIGPLWSGTYDQVIDLVYELAHVTRLTLESCLMTPRLLSYIDEHRLLESLEFRACQEHDSDAQTPVDGKFALSLKELSYHHLGGPLSWSFPTRLLECSVSSLTSLTIPHAEVPRVVEIVGDHFPSIRNLTIVTSRHTDSFQISTLLKSCSSLQVLSLRMRASGPLPQGYVQLEGLTGDIVPHLESICGDLHIVCALVPGRPVHRIALYDINSAPIQAADVDLLRASLVPVTDLTIQVSTESSLSSLEERFDHLVAAFSNLSALTVCLMSYKAKSQRKKIMDIMTCYLYKWPTLRACRLFFTFNIARDLVQEYGPSRRGPGSRDHPSLVEFGIVSVKRILAWLWLPGEGWVLRELEKSQERYNDAHLFDW